MWTKQHCKIYKHSDERYPSDLTDAEWSHLEPLIPPAKSGGRPRGTDMREAMNAILYILRTGCPWRYLPRGGSPPRSTVYNIFRNFKRDGVWDAIWDSLAKRTVTASGGPATRARSVPSPPPRRPACRFRPPRGEIGLHGRARRIARSRTRRATPCARRARLNLRAISERDRAREIALEVQRAVRRSRQPRHASTPLGPVGSTPVLPLAILTW